jgi:hypothetical protein
MAFVDNGKQWAPLELAGKANSEPVLEVRKVAGEIIERMQGVAVRALNNSTENRYASTQNG